MLNKKGLLMKFDQNLKYIVLLLERWNFVIKKLLYFKLIIFIIGLDIPTRENSTGGQWLHWLVGNIPGNAVAKGETLAEYVGPGKYLEYGSGKLLNNLKENEDV